jgi:shikimate kinase
MMGSGKTTIGRLLAEATTWPQHDNDLLLQQLGGMTARELLDARGERELRAAENEALAFGLTCEPPCIMEAAAGTILSADSRARLAQALVVWLRAAPETLLRRSGSALHRPWLDRGVEWMRQAVEERDPLYESVADLIIKVETTGPADAVRVIVEWLGNTSPCAEYVPSAP